MCEGGSRDYCLPRVEVELAFVSAAAQGSRREPARRAARDGIRGAAMEIVDARLQNPRKILDTVADNGAAPDSSSAAAIGPMETCLGGAHVPQLRDRGDRSRAGVLGHPALGVAGSRTGSARAA